jgi:hypothetical protein
MVEQALRDPISVAMLKTDGSRIMEKFHVQPGPRIGWALNALLEEVLEKPDLNIETYLDTRTEALLAMGDSELKKLGDSGKKLREEREEAEVQKILEKHHVC